MVGWTRIIILILILCVFTGCTSTGSLHPTISRTVDELNQISQTIGQKTETLLDTNEDPEKKEAERNSIVGYGSALFGIGAGALCATTIGKKHGRIGMGLCALGGLASQQLANIIGRKITQGLKEDEQREVLVAVTESLKSNQPVTIELPDSDTTIEVMPSQNQHTKSITIPIYIDSLLVTSDIPTLNILGDPYRVKRDSFIYESATSQSSETRISKNEDIHVFGKINNPKRMLVGRWVLSNDVGYAVPMGIGFVEEDQLQQAEYEVDESSIKEEPNTFKIVNIKAIVTCQEIDMKRTDNDGKIIEDTAVRCLGPDGLPINT